MAEIQDHKKTKTFADIPSEIVLENILPRLPIQAALRLKLVSKTWYNAITELNFFKSRLRCKSTLPQRVLLREETENTPRVVMSLSYDEESNTLVSLAELNCNGISEYRGFYNIVDSCHGLVCLNLVDIHAFAIWNPTTHQFKEIPYSQQMFSSRMMILTAAAFGYCALKDDYIIFAGFSKSRPTYQAYKSNLFYVFSFRSGVWKELTELRGTHFRGERGVWIKGKFYWPRNDFVSRNVLGLFCFDLNTEQMKQIPISAVFSDYGYNWVKHIFEIDGFLSFSCFKDDEPNHIWKLSTVEGVDSWVKVFVFPSPNFTVFGFAGIGSCFAHFLGKLKLLDLEGDGLNDGGGGDHAYESIEGIDYIGRPGSLQRSSSFVETFGAFKIKDSSS